MKIYNQLIISSIILLVLLVAWPILMVVSNPTGTNEEQLKWVSSNVALYKTQFFLAFLLAPAILYMMLAQINWTKIRGLFSRLGLIFLSVYVVLVSVAYGSQAILIPRLLANGMIEQSKIWYFGSPHSITLFINLTGYFFWALGTLFVFSSLVYKKGLIKYIGMLYVLSAILSIVAFLGLLADSKFMVSMTMPSGLLIIPIAIITFIEGFKIKIKTSKRYKR